MDEKFRGRSSTFSYTPNDTASRTITLFKSEQNLSTIQPSRDSQTLLGGSHLTSTLLLAADGDKSVQTSGDIVQTPGDSAADNCCMKLFNWRVLLIPRFLLMALSILLFDLGVLATYAVLPSLADETGEY